RPAMVMVAK
ncbi:grpE family protein, partial [Vibrio parahaemolyticus V-223/04]